jgi:putative transposase
MNDYLLPYCDIMAWCLMPNHFHWMVYVRQTELESVNSRGATQSRTPTSPTSPTTPTLNQSIGILLASYTRAINQVNKTSGSLFRQKTKSDCITNALEISHSYYNLGFGTSILLHDPEKEYPQACFNYIHQNPVKAGLVKQAEDWEFSSYRDIIGMRAGKLINRERIAEFELSL